MGKFTELTSYPKEIELQEILNDMDVCDECLTLCAGGRLCHKHTTAMQKYFFGGVK